MTLYDFVAQYLMGQNQPLAGMSCHCDLLVVQILRIAHFQECFRIDSKGEIYHENSQNLKCGFSEIGHRFPQETLSANMCLLNLPLSNQKGISPKCVRRYIWCTFSYRKLRRTKGEQAVYYVCLHRLHRCSGNPRAADTGDCRSAMGTGH